MKDNPELLWHRINALEAALRDAAADFERNGFHLLSDVYLKRMMDDGVELPKPPEPTIEMIEDSWIEEVTPLECQCERLTASWSAPDRASLCGHVKECPRFFENFESQR